VTTFYYFYLCFSPAPRLRSFFAYTVAFTVIFFLRLAYALPSPAPLLWTTLISPFLGLIWSRPSPHVLSLEPLLGPSLYLLILSLFLSPTVGRIKERVARLSRHIRIRSAPFKSQALFSRTRIRWNLFCLYVAGWVTRYTPSLSLRVTCDSFHLALLLSFGGVILWFLVSIFSSIFSPPLPLLLFARRVYSFCTLCLPCAA
jgi:hypothetical protein